MLKILTADQVKTIDRYTIEHEPVRPIDLVERAARAFVREFSLRFPKQRRVVVFAGPGNNGADALAIARMLFEESFAAVETWLINPAGKLSDECAQNSEILRQMGRDIRFKEVHGRFSSPALGKHDIVVDGLFGAGLNRPLDGGFARLVDYINHSDATIVSIDLPSGLFGEDNRANNPDSIIRADAVFAFAFPKLAFLLADNEPYIKEWKVLDIGLHPDAIDAAPADNCLLSEADIDSALQPRSRFAHKGCFGHALLIAGSRGKTGAAVLAAQACLRSGAGRLSVRCPACSELILQTAVPEAMLCLDPHNDHFSALPDLTPFSAIAIGPGMGKQPDSITAFTDLLSAADQPLVIDADALNILADNPNLCQRIPPNSILTPHAQEFDRLANTSHPSAFDRLAAAKAFAAHHRLFLVLKGAYTAICSPNGRTLFNGTGNPGMATAGSGDVLTGVILGLLAAGYPPNKAAALGPLLHGAAGDMAACFHSPDSLTASDIVRQLGSARLYP